MQSYAPGSRHPPPQAALDHLPKSLWIAPEVESQPCLTYPSWRNSHVRLACAVVPSCAIPWQYLAPHQHDESLYGGSLFHLSPAVYKGRTTLTYICFNRRCTLQ